MQEVRDIMGDNVIGRPELISMEKCFLELPIEEPAVTCDIKTLVEKKKDYYLILGVSKLSNGLPTTIRNMKGLFGKDPNVMEPCFYNQDWYDNEKFIDIPILDEWFFIRKSVYDDSRAVQPSELAGHYNFPTAINCTYAFFTAWLTKQVKLWYYDFVWCSDVDHNGDRVYVGKYHDIDGINKNGFSIHRHLALRSCYGCVDC